jgi:hypothetical protein
MRANVERYVANCHKCRQALIPQDRAPGYLHLLSIPQRLWQYLTINYKLFLTNKHGYNILFVVIDRLSKQLYLIPCYKTINARGIAELFLKYI